MGSLLCVHINESIVFTPAHCSIVRCMIMSMCVREPVCLRSVSKCVSHGSDRVNMVVVLRHVLVDVVVVCLVNRVTRGC